MARSGAPGQAGPAAGRTWSIRRGAAGILAAVVVGGAVLAACTDTSQANSGSVRDAGDTQAAGTVAAGAASSAAAASQGEKSDADSGSSAAASGSAAGAPSKGAAAAPGSKSGGSGSSSNSGKGDAPAEPPVALDGRQIIRTGSFAIEVSVAKTDDPEADRKSVHSAVSGLAVKARAAAAGVGGFVSASDGDATTQSITLRVPVSQYDAARDRLAGLGDMTGSETSQDVTGQLADMDGRIATMKAGVDRIRKLLASATKIGDVIAIESELSGREADLEATLRKRAAVADQVALSTITLTIAGKIVSGPPAPKKKALTIGYRALHLSVPGPTGFVGGVVGALDVLTNVARGVATLAGAILPFVPFVLLVALLIGWGRRRFPGLLRTGRSAATVSGSTPVQQPGAAGGAAG